MEQGKYVVDCTSFGGYMLIPFLMEQVENIPEARLLAFSSTLMYM